MAPTSPANGICTYTHARKQWNITSAPHIRIKFKRVFPAVDEHKDATLHLSNTEANARDLLWFFDRYPHDMGDGERFLLQANATAAEARQLECESILAGTTILPPIELALPLRHYQAQAADLLRTTKALLCADSLGLGKTAVGIAAAAETHPAVIVCQTHLQRQWARELRLFAPNLRVRIAPTGRAESLHSFDVLIITYSKLSGWADYLKRWAKAIIMDEAQELRHGPQTTKGTAAAAIAEKCEVKLLLTATPVYNYGGELFNLINLIAPGALGALGEFIAEWCIFSQDEKKMVVRDPKALGFYLREQHLMIRRTRADVGRELLPMQQLAHEVPYDAKVLDRLNDDMLQLAAVILRQGGSGLEKGQAAQQFSLKLRQATGIAKAPYVADFVTDLVRQGEKVILTLWHRECHTIAAHAFTEAKVPHWFYTGEETAAAKDAAVTAFIASEDPGVFIMSVRSGAGINGLQNVSSTIVHGELDWSPQVHAQCDGRLGRDGQSKNVSIIYLVAQGGSDPIIAGLLGIKMEQGLGITDPTMDLADVPLASPIDEAQAQTNRIAAMALDFVNRHGK